MRAREFDGKERRGLSIEKLESRVLLAADLTVSNAYLVGVDAEPVDSVLEGQRVLTRVNYTTTDLQENQSYVIRFELDGVPVESQRIQGQSGVNLPFFRFRTIGYAAPGTRTVTVILDAENEIAEADETNNRVSFEFTPHKPNLDTKFRLPLGGVASKDWTLLNHHDVDLREGSRADFSGGFLQYDNHAGWDFFVPNFQEMDQGVPILSVASGVVVDTDDGHFDREDFWDFTLPDPRKPNYVIIDHGNGWRTEYFHLLRDSVSVEVGDTVFAGQTLGLIGSSGITDGPHLHFVVKHDGMTIEPMYAVDEYFEPALAYLGNREPRVTASGITDRNPIPDFKEFPNDIRQFELNFDVNPWLWQRFEYINQGDEVVIEWLRPDGTTHRRAGWTAPGDIRYLRYWSWTNAITMVGTWTVSTSMNGVVLGSQQFQVSDQPSPPEIDIRLGDTYLINRRSTPIEFSDASLGAAPPTIEIEISNLGNSTLRLSDFQLPESFEFVGSVPTAVAPDATEIVGIRMRTNRIGRHRGELAFQTNDLDESEIRLAIEGFVNGTAPTSAPKLSLSGVAIVIESGSALRHILPSVVLEGVADQVEAGTRLVAKIHDGKEVGDRLLFDGIDAGFTQRDNRIYLGGNHVADVIRDGSDGVLEWQTVSESDGQLIESLFGAISFWQQNPELSSRRRMLSAQLFVPDLPASNLLFQPIYYSADQLEHPPHLSPLADQVTNEDTQLGPIALNVDLVDDGLSTLSWSTTSSNHKLVEPSDIDIQLENGVWKLYLMPKQNEFGESLLSLAAEDSEGNQTTTDFVLEVISVNDLPTISSVDDQTVEINQSKDVAFRVTDVETDVTQLDLTASSSNEQLIDSTGLSFSGSGVNRELRLVPKTNESGSSTIKITVRDADGGEQHSTFTLMVEPESERPDISLIEDLIIDEDGSQTASFTVSDNISAPENISVQVSSSNTQLFDAASFELSGQGRDRLVQVKPRLNRWGQGVVNVFATDEAGNTAIRSFDVLVNPVNDPPSLKAPSELFVLEDVELQVTPISQISAGALEDQPLRMSVSSHDDWFESLESNYIDGSSFGEIRWKPMPNVSGSTVLSIVLEDGGLDGDLATKDDNAQLVHELQVTIRPVNDAPSLSVPSELNAMEDQGVVESPIHAVSAGPLETQDLRLTATHDGSSQFFEVFEILHEGNESDALLRWRSSQDVSGDVQVVLRLEDAGLDENLDTPVDNAIRLVTLTLSVNPVNDAPSFEVDAPPAQQEDAELASLELREVSAGPMEEQELAWLIEASDLEALDQLFVNTEISPPSISWKPVENFFGSVDLILSLIDGGGDNDLTTEADNAVTVTTLGLSFESVNDEPRITSVPEFSLPENSEGGQVGQEQIEFIDVDLGDQHVWEVDDPRFGMSEGRLTLLNNSIVDYEAEPVIPLVVTLRDAAGTEDQRAFDVQVTDVNEQPSDLSIDRITVFQEISAQTIGQLSVVDEDLGQTHMIVPRDTRFEVKDGRLILREGETISPGEGDSLEIVFDVTDSGNDPQSNELTLTLASVSVSSPWQNPRDGVDVNADDLVSPIDALLVINFLNDPANDRSLSPQAYPPIAAGPFWDTNGDRFVSPLDVLLVINARNNAANGEGEFSFPEIVIKRPEIGEAKTSPERALAIHEGRFVDFEFGLGSSRRQFVEAEVEAVLAEIAYGRVIELEEESLPLDELAELLVRLRSFDH